MSHCPECGQPIRSGEPMTRTERRILDFIVDYREETGYYPLMREIAEHMGYRSLATVHEHVTHLAEKGWLDTEYNKGIVGARAA